MLKAKEIEILRECVEKLGADSYCGPWLQDQIPFIEHDMRSDFLPTPSWGESRRIHENALANAKAEAERIIRQAKEQAEAIRKDAEKFADNTRRRLAMDLRKALESVEQPPPPRAFPHGARYGEGDSLFPVRYSRRIARI